MLAEDVRLAIDTIADLVAEPAFRKKDLAVERSVIAEEIGDYEDDAQGRLEDSTRRSMYGDHPLGRSILGDVESLGRIGRDDLENFVTRCYTPNRMVLCVAGAVEHDAIVAMAADAFGGLSRSSSLVPDDRPSWIGGDHRDHRDDSMAHVFLAFPGVEHGHPDRYAHRLLISAISGNTSSCLYQEIRDRRGLVYDIGGYVHHLSDTGSLQFGFSASPDKAAEALRVLCGELSTIARDGVDEDALRTAKAQYRASFLKDLERSSSRSVGVAMALTFDGEVRPMAEVVRSLERVTIADVNRVAAGMVLCDPAFAATGDIRGLPDRDQILRILGG
jgi:predicted Zn-dependent peptidase